jgi:hypothetical protein
MLSHIAIMSPFLRWLGLVLESWLYACGVLHTRSITSATYAKIAQGT